MVLPKEEVSSNPLCAKNDSFTSKKKTRMLGSAPQRLKGETSSSSQMRDEISSASSNKRRVGSPYLDPHLKLKLQALTPRNPGKETAEGVQKFINHVSNILEKKNPFKEKFFDQKVKSEVIKKPISRINKKSEEKEELKITGKWLFEQKSLTDGTQEISETKEKKNPFREPSFSQKIKFEAMKKINCKTCKKPEEKEGSKSLRNRTEDILETQEKKKLWNEQKPESKDSISRKRASTENERKGSPQTITIEPSESYKNYQSLIDSKKPRRVSSRETSSTNSIENLEKVSEMIMQLKAKKNRPSEIPLRKNKQVLERKIVNKKPLPLPMAKFVEDVDSNTSIDFMQKQFSDLEDLGIISSSEEKFANLANIDSMDFLEELPRAEEIKSINTEKSFKINKCYENDYNPDNSYELIGTKSKVLDFAKLKSSSFTVLNNNTYLKLESYHQQNLATKDVMQNEKLITSPSSKLKILSSKTSFNSLKGKGSKKNLSSRLSSKGNKPALKAKAKKIKKSNEDSVQNKKAEDFNKISTQMSNLMNVDGENFENKSKSNMKKSKYSSEKLEERASKVSTVIEKLNLEIDLIKSEITISSVERNPVKNEEKHLGSPKTLEELSKNPNNPSNNKLLEKPSKTFVIDKCVKETKNNQIMKKEVKSPTKLSRKPASKDKNEEKINLGDLILKGTALLKKNKSTEKVKGLEKLKLETKTSSSSRKSYEMIREPKTLVEDWVYPNENEIFDRNKVFGESEKAEDVNVKSQMEKDLGTEETPKKAYNSSISLESKPKSVSLSPHVKEKANQKLRSDLGDRWLLRSIQPFNPAVPFQNKIKPDAKLRSGLTKFYNRESKSSDKKDIFEESAAAKLKRRNSEPDSFRGFIWKRADLATPRDNHASVSSMASSLRHMNTDELEDFIFWEAMPQKMTSCWEMSLYHFKRPWSVLSCSIFKDNRESNTPGSILQCLRNGGTQSERQNEKGEIDRRNSKDNPFDVEPSIAQKNIDIRNWLAALNFQTLSPTSTDALREGNFCTQPLIIHQHLNKNQVNPKRRKVLPRLKFHDESLNSRSEQKKKERDSSTKWNVNEMEGLMDLIRRKSGGFVTAEQFLNPELSTCKNVTLNYCTCSKSSKEMVIRETQTDLKLEPINGEGIFDFGDSNTRPEGQPSNSSLVTLKKTCAPEGHLLPPNTNIYKYLFILTVCVFMIYLFFDDKIC